MMIMETMLVMKSQYGEYSAKEPYEIGVRICIKTS